MADEDVIEILVEVPKGSRNKYEYDQDRGLFRLDRRLLSPIVYPADYGVVLDTCSEDGDQLDALVLVQEATFPGCLVRGKVLGILWMTDEHRPDAKIICVPDRDPQWAHVTEVSQLPGHLRDEIEHFFNVYKDLEPGKVTSTAGFGDRAAAVREIESARIRAYRGAAAKRDQTP